MHLHQLGILHRDLRAANVLVAAVDPIRVVIADFGVSHQLAEYADREHNPLASDADPGPNVQVGRMPSLSVLRRQRHRDRRSESSPM